MDKVSKGKELNFVIGIGASAGGMEAIHELFDNMPADTNFSFVILQHLSSDYKSLMPELLSRHTPMPVFVGESDMVLEPNHIYLIPNKYMMTVKGRRLMLHDKLNNHQPNNAVDIFFESLALNYKEQAVGIILSGTGTDGTKGIELIKANGGIVIVQDPVTAKFDGMPNSAISTGFADIILAPEMIAEEMIDYLQHAPLVKTFQEQNQKDEYLVTGILENVMESTGYDFREYKKPTILRRLSKRMGEVNSKNLPDYLSKIKSDPNEAKELSKEFLIRVTRFFRDQEAFDHINLNVLPGLFTKKGIGNPIKVWVVGCSTGEEAYSLAMLLQEYMEHTKREDVQVKIFATDIDNEALEIGSKGVYPATITNEVPANLLKKYFNREGDFYKVTPELRKLVVFAHHDITKDPPFSKLDMISCRNMLIYMGISLQKIIMKAFHFALNLDGFLVLGPSENIGSLKEATIEVDRKWRIYKCILKAGQGDYATFPLGSVNTIKGLKVPVKAKNGLANVAEIFKETLLEEEIYAGIFIDRDFEIKQATGQFKKFINFPEGSFNFNLLKLVHPDLSSSLSICVRKAIKENEKVVMQNVKMGENGTTSVVDIIVKPYLQQKEYLQPFLFVVIHELKNKPDQKSKSKKLPSSNEEMWELERELKETRENLQALVEEVESANEELQTSNEEIISSNEELQSTNEELQSLNEELHTVNVEHQLKIKELLELNDDLNNYFRNSDIGQVIIDKNLLIRKFSPSATQQIKLIESDIGRSILDISNNFSNLDFINDIKKVMISGKMVEKEVLMDNGSIFLMKLNPYLRIDRSADGVVISFVDISHIKKLDSILKAVFNSSTSGITAKQAVRNSDNKIIDFRYTMTNTRAAFIMKMDEDQVLGSNMLESYPGMEKAYFDRYVAVVETGIADRFEFLSPENGNWFEVVCVKMLDGLVTTFTDITDKKNSADLLQKGYADLKVTSDKLQSTNEQLETSNLDLYQFASIASHDLKEPLRKIQAFGNLLEEKIRHKLEPNEKNYLDKIIKASARMQNLIEDVLTFSRLSNTELPLVKTNLTEVVHTVVDDLEIAIQQKKAEIVIGKLPELNLVSAQMHQLFHNLIANSLKFNESKPPVIEIKQDKISPALSKKLGIKPAGYVAISVKDNGIGFEKEFGEKIFKMFQRLDPTHYAGTGIGLAICKKIAENHGGFLYAESELGKGSKFLILFPVSKL